MDAELSKSVGRVISDGILIGSPKPGRRCRRDRVLLVDDLIATGGTAGASIMLIEQLGGVVVEACFVIDLPDLGGRKRLESMGQKVFSLCEFEGD